MGCCPSRPQVVQEGKTAGVVAPPACSPGDGCRLTARPEASGIVPLDEDARVQAVHDLNVLGSPPSGQQRFQAIVALIKSVYSMPVAAVALLDDRVHILCVDGSDPQFDGLPRAGTLCEWVLANDTPSLVVVEDTTKDARFKCWPLVVGGPKVRFYAGAPLLGTSGHRYGTLFIMDFEPRSFQPEKYAMLTHFAEITTRELERDKALQWQQQAAQKRLLRAVDCFQEGISVVELSPRGWSLLYANDAFLAAARQPDLSAGAAQADATNNNQHGSGGSSTGGARVAASNGPATLCEVSGAAASSGDSSSSGASRAVAVDFWSRFQLSPGSAGLEGASAAVAAGQAFTLHVRSVCGQNGGTAPELSLLFRPADSHHLRPDIPHIGIGMVGMQDSTELVPLAPAASSVSGAAGGLPSQSDSPPLYFAIIQCEGTMGGEVMQQAQQGQRAQQAEAQQAHQGQQTAAQQGQAQQAATSQGQQPVSQPGSEPLGDRGSGEGAGGLPEPNSSIIPSFLAHQPEVMKEVTLGLLIGTGAMGRCYRGTWQGGRVAVKIIDCRAAGAGPPSSGRVTLGYWTSPTRAERQPERQAAMVEALLGRSLSHPHIVTTYAHGVSEMQAASATSVQRGSQVWIVQELCSRGSMLDAIDRGVLRLPEGGPNMRAVLACAQDIAGAMLYLHSHWVVHGDLTPSNVLLTSCSKDARRYVCKVADFGLASIGHNVQYVGLGTITHMPPELITEGALSTKTDVYSFGVLLLEMFIGKRAWLGMTFMQIMTAVSSGKQPFPVPEDCPPELAALLRRCLHVDPAQRPGFAAVLEEVEGMLRLLPPRQATAGGLGSGDAPASHHASRAGLGHPPPAANGRPPRPSPRAEVAVAAAAASPQLLGSDESSGSPAVSLRAVIAPREPDIPSPFALPTGISPGSRAVSPPRHSPSRAVCAGASA